MKKGLVIIMDIVFAAALAAFIYYEMSGVNILAEANRHGFKFVVGETSISPADQDPVVDAVPAGEENGMDVTEQNRPTYYQSYAGSERPVCMIGDSRFVGMWETRGEENNITWIAEDGVGHNWYWKNRDEIEALDRDTVIVYELGINSIEPREEIKALEDLKSMGFLNVYALTLTAVDEEKAAGYGYSITNEQVMEYNSFLKSHLPAGVKCIDSYTMLYEDIHTVDGLHYDEATYGLWYDQIMQSIMGSN